MSVINAVDLDAATAITYHMAKPEGSMSKIKLPPDQEAFALKIGATHYEEPPEQLRGVGTYWKKECGCVMWHTISGSSGWISSHYGCIPEDVMPIDFTQSQEVDWKALAKELFDAIDFLEIGYEHISENDSDEIMYEGQFSAGSLRKAEQALQRAREAGL